MALSGPGNLGNASVGLSADLSRLQRDLAEAEGSVEAAMRTMGAQSANPSVDLSKKGFDAGAAEVEAKKAALGKNVDIKITTDRSAIRTLGNALFGLDDKLKKLGKSGRKTTISLGPFNTTLKGLITTLGLGGPLIADLGGALVALTGSLAQATVGAAGLTAGLLGGAIPALAGTALAIKPVITQIGTASKQMKIYRKDVLLYGKSSTEAKNAQKLLNSSLKNMSPAARAAFKGFNSLRQSFLARTSGVRKDFVSTLGQAIKTAKADLPGFTKDVTSSFDALSKGTDQWLKGLRSPEAQAILHNLMTNFRKSLPAIMHGVGELITALARFASVSSDFLPKEVKMFDQWATGVAKGTQNANHLHDTVHKLVDQFNAWVRFLGVTGKLLGVVLGGGAKSGKNLLNTITELEKKWTKFLQSGKGQKAMSAFFSHSVGETKLIGQLLGQVVQLMVAWGRVFGPVLRGATQAVVAIGNVLTQFKQLRPILQGIGIIIGGLWVTEKVISFYLTLKKAAVAIKGLATSMGILKASEIGAATAADTLAASELAAGAAATTAAAEAAAAQGIIGGGMAGGLGAASPTSTAAFNASRGSSAAIAEVEAATQSQIAASVVPAAESAGPAAAKGLMSSMGKAIPLAAAAVGLGNILISATQGDWKDAGFKAGGALVGGALGALAGPEGALLGAGIGSLAGGLLGGLFKGEPAKKMHALTKDVAKLGRASAQARKQFAQGGQELASTTASLTSKHKKVIEVTKEVHKWEKKLQADRKRFGPGSDQVLADERKLLDVRHRQVKAIHAENQAEQKHGLARKSYILDARHMLVTDAKQVQILKNLAGAQEKNFRQVQKDSPNTEKARKAGDRWHATQQKLHRSTTQQTRDLGEVQQKLGGKTAKGLEHAAKDTGKYSGSVTHLARALKNFGKTGVVPDAVTNTHAFNKEFKDAKNIDDYRQASRTLIKAGIDPLHTSMKDVVGVLGRSKTALAQISGRSGMQEVQNQSKTLTGRLETLKKQGFDKTTQGGKHDVSDLKSAVSKSVGTMEGVLNNALHAMGVSKVNFSASKNQRGGPVLPKAQEGMVVPGSGSGDKVLMQALVEPGEGAFVMNRNAMAAYQQFNDAYPRFQEGGMLKRLRGGGKAAKGGGGYTFPIAGPWTQGRIDMGVDMAVAKPTPLVAIGNSTIIGTGAPGWPGGGGVQLTLDDGRYAGRSIYYNEHVNSSVSAGQKVRVGQRIGTMLPGFPNIEIGWADPSGAASAASHYSEGQVTAEGKSFQKFLNTLSQGGITPMWKDLKGMTLHGPKGQLRSTGQGVMNKFVDAANAYGRKKSKMGHGFGKTGPIKGWARVGATYEGLDGQQGAYGTVGGLGFAELLVAGANAGLKSQDLSATLGLHNPMAPHTRLAFRMPGSKRSAVAEKNDIGSGQAGNTHYKVDIQTGLMNAIGWHPNQDVEVGIPGKRRGGSIKRLATGGTPSGGGSGGGKHHHHGGKGDDPKKHKHPNRRESVQQYGNITPFLYVKHVEPKLRKLHRQNVTLQENIDHWTTVAGEPQSPGGSDTTPGEARKLIRFNTNLLDNLKQEDHLWHRLRKEYRHKATHHKGKHKPAYTKWLEDHVKMAKQKIIGLEGHTGHAGTIFDVEDAIAQLKGTLTEAAADRGLEQTALGQARYQLLTEFGGNFIGLGGRLTPPASPLPVHPPPVGGGGGRPGGGGSGPGVPPTQGGGTGGGAAGPGGPAGRGSGSLSGHIGHHRHRHHAGAGGAGGTGGTGTHHYKTVNVTNHYTTQPTDPHTWSRDVAFELQAMG